MSVRHLQQAARGPVGPQADDHTLARRDLDAAVALARAREGSLLTAGEHTLLGRFAALPVPARALYARLFARKDTAFPVGSLRYPEVPSAQEAAARVVSLGFGEWAHALWSDERLAERLSVPALRGLLRSAGQPTAGTKACLLKRRAAAEVRVGRAEPRIALRHRGLFQRVVRLALSGARGGLERLVLARLGVLRFPRYAPTGGGGLWRTRGDLLAWEDAVHRRSTLSDEEVLADLPRALSAVEAEAVTDPLRARWSARRHNEALCLRALALLERAGDGGQSVAGYQRLLQARVRRNLDVRKRLALCLARRGDTREAVQVCAKGLEGPTAELQLDPAAWALHRTGRRLARKAGRGWRPLPPLDAPRERVLRLPAGPPQGGRPTFVVGETPLWAEPAVRLLLREVGREARHVERSLWTTLFAVLLRPALFAPIPGMLPSPLLQGPLDLGTASFWAARAPLLEALLADLREDAPKRLDAALADHGTEQVVGARWDTVGPDDLRRVVADLPGTALASILQVLAQDWHGARRGLPDLVVLPGPEARLPGTALGRLQPGVFFVEIKTARDRLSDAQRIWLHRMARVGASAELWRVEATG